MHTFCSRRTAPLVAAILLLLSRASHAGADERAVKLLQESVAVYKSARTLAADFAVHQEVSGSPAMEYHGTFRAQKPDRYLIDCAGVLTAQMSSDGKSVLFYLKPQNAYAQFPAGGQSMNLTVTSVPPLTLFFNPGKMLAPNTPTSYAGKETWEGTEYEIVEQTLGTATMRYYIGPDRMVARLRVHLEAGAQKQDVDATLHNIRRDVAFTLADFPTTPPKDARAFEMPMPGGAPLAVGQKAPAFALPRPEGGQITLSDTSRNRKAVVITFWFYACATCRQEFPRLQQLYAALKAQGLEVVAVNSNDDAQTIRKYLKGLQATFPVGMDDVGARHYGVAKQYGVGLYPTTYVLDGNGVITARLIGFKEPELRAALAKVGIH